MAVGDDFDIPDTGAVFTFGKSRFADNVPSKFWIKNDVVVEIACGDEHTAVITETGRLFMIGSNDMGQLGLGSTKTVHKPSCVKALKPEKALHVACGRAHTLVACGSGKVYCWGFNGDGQLGTNDQSDRQSPVLVMSLENPPIAVAAGSAHSVVLADTGELYVWGSNTEGQLGLDSEEVFMPTLLTLPEHVVGIACGYYHTVAITESGEAYTWGDTDHGKLGLAEDQLLSHRQPQPVILPEKIVQVAAGSAHTLFLSESGAVYSCGLGSSGELGQGGGRLESWVPQLVNEPSSHTVVSISAGGNHSAAITDCGYLLSWGCGRHGKLCQGEENFASQFSPIVVRRLRHISVILVGCGGCHTMVLGYRRVEAGEATVEDENNEVPEQNTTSSARARRRLGDGVLPPLKSAGLPPIKHTVLPTVPDTEAVVEQYEEQDQPDEGEPHIVKVNADDAFNGMSAEESDTQSEEKEDESDTVEEDESKKQNQPEKKGNRLTRFFSGLGRKKNTPSIKDSDDADVESPTVPVSPESGEHLVEEDAELESIEGTNNEETVAVEAPIEAFTTDVKSRDEEINSSLSGSKSDHKRSKACVII
ncbi:X-linked retinitis pigmentosa GTPase regulator-like [Penaeus indicus]|uniref:X-linked retinitis pigmentosa GTPase regulator-like n=1 Tax=Penaeus indicus TaxID=29960 RepID=UPI00300D8BDD